MKPGSAPPTDYPLASIASKILWLRAQKGMLDADLAALYGVPTKRLNEQVRRNAERLPGRFHVSGERSGTRRLEVAIFDLKVPDR